MQQKKMAFVATASAAAVIVVVGVVKAATPSCWGDQQVGSQARTISDTTGKKTCGPYKFGFDYKAVAAGGEVTWECDLGEKLVQENDRMQCITSQTKTGYKCDPLGGKLDKTRTNYKGCNTVTAATDNDCLDPVVKEEDEQMAGLTKC
ncbi:MAG TPA: hypothetical protein VK324_09175 [Tepidisphaeraceae bacterium]|nr:hypothetical protein [Tepidisphaeraceae bacterium]